MLSYGANASPNTGWRKASFCASGECVEVAAQDGMILLRDSKDIHGGVLRYSVDEFRAFVNGIQAGEFDDFLA